MRLTFSVILPHTRIFGGVKRFLEIGNLLIERGHHFVIFTPEGKAPDWFPFRGEVRQLALLDQAKCDALFITEPEYLPQLRNSNATVKIFYAVLERHYIRKIARSRDILVLANSTSLYQYLGGESRDHIVKAVGGIDLNKFRFEARPRNTPFTVLVYGRFYRRKKGTMLVVKACEQLYRRGFNIRLLLFDTPVDDNARKKVEAFTTSVPFKFFVDYPVAQVADLYRMADVFVSAERNAGWANTVAEAMASGVPVIATRSGTKDIVLNNETGLVVWRYQWFIKRALAKLYYDENLRLRLRDSARERIAGFSWQALTDTIERIVKDRVS